MNVKNNYKECITPISYFNITPNILMKIEPQKGYKGPVSRLKSRYGTKPLAIL